MTGGLKFQLEIIRLAILSKKSIFVLLSPGFLYKLAASLNRQTQRKEKQQRRLRKTLQCLGFGPLLIAGSHRWLVIIIIILKMHENLASTS